MLTSYSQGAEDLLAALYLRTKENIRYIDVGCYLPIWVSNTYFFYERGGEGVCIDANPAIKEEFIAARPRDTFVNCGVSTQVSDLTYYRFTKPVFNTFSEARRDEVVRKRGQLIEPLAVPVKPLTQILREADWCGRYGDTADLLTIDVEGLEYEVITSLDFSYVRPKLIVMEMCAKSARIGFTKACAHLRELGYKMCGQTGHDVFFLDARRQRRN